MPGDDECFYRDLREAFVGAGATDREIDTLAVRLRPFIVENIPGDRERRIEQFELISEHLACTDMTVRIGKGDAYILVEFPNRPKIH